MHVAMDAQEVTLFKSFVDMSERYLEFGSGGSTWLACQARKDWVISIDSSEQWLANVADATQDCATKPTLVHVDIGQTLEWGYPANRDKEGVWPQYHEGIWQKPESHDADLYFIDGRFRVACFMQCLLHSKPSSFIAIHDFSNRPQYHTVKRATREIARANNMSVFQKLPQLNFDEVQQILHAHRLNPE